MESAIIEGINEEKFQYIYKVKSKGCKGKKEIEEEIISIEYFFKNGLRHILPYYWRNEARVKGRWLGKSVLEVFQKEFPSRSIEYYKRALKEGKISLDRSKVQDIDDTDGTDDIIIRAHDIVKYTLHKHEPPISSQLPTIICETEELLVVDKPGSVAVHPVGRFYFNSLIWILKMPPMINKWGIKDGEEKKKELFPVHRLDRLTSGILILAKSSKVAALLSQQFASRSMIKVYLAKVVGKFPTFWSTSESMNNNNNNNSAIDNRRRPCPIVVDAPIHVTNIPGHTNHVCYWPEEGKAHESKPSRTAFISVGYNEIENTSIVLARPFTGRTHQIRVHLKHLGHSISNDILYGPPNQGRVLKTSLQTQKIQEKLKAQGYDSKHISKINCLDCFVGIPNPKKEELCIYLHAYYYKFGLNHSWTTSIPLFSGSIDQKSIKVCLNRLLAMK